MKYLLLIILSITIIPAVQAQFTKAYLGVDGLTCSQCSRSVEMQLRKLPFITQVNMDLEHTRGELLMDAKKNPDFRAIARAVRAAGFSVGYLKADFAAPADAPLQDGVLRYKGQAYKLTGDKMPGNTAVTFVFLDPDFTATTGKKKKADDPKPSKTYLVRIQ